jgi:two-component system, cell cycle sensor histidine kinase and response regulator CckA
MSPYGNALPDTNNGTGESATMFSQRPGPPQSGLGETAGREAVGEERKAEHTVLVVNDEPDVAELMSLQLRNAGFRVLTAFDGREGYEVAQAEHPDLIISDVVMPRLTGIEMCRLIRAHTRLRTTPVLLVSAARRDSESVVEGLKAGADDYLEAPYDSLRLAARAARLIERERAGKALRASESEMRALFAAMTDVVIVLDADGRYLKVAPTNPSYLYRPPAELVGKTVHEVFPEEQADFFLAHVRRTLSEGRKHNVEYPLQIEGTEIWFDGCVSPMSHDSVLWIARDITERKRTEEALREGEERYRLLFESNPQPMWVYDIETLRFLAVNEAAIRHYGYSRAEFLAMTVKDIRPPEDVPALMNNVASVRGGFDEAGTWRHLKKDGSRIDVEVTSHELVFAGRRAELVLANDVTERKRVERELRQSEERYRDLVENAHDLIYTQDLEGNYTSINSAVERVTGYTREEALGMNVKHVAAPEYLEKARRMIAQKLAGESVTAYEVEIIAKDGRRVRVELNTSLIIQDGVVVGVQGIARDVTERKELEEQLRQAQKMEAVGKLAGGVAHDFNNLLTVINGYSDLLAKRLRAEDPLRLNVEEIKKAGERATSLTRQLLAFSRKQVLQPKVIDLNEVVRETEKMLRRLIGEDVELRASLGPWLGSVKADPGQMEQVLMNLAVNARDAMPHGGKLTISTENVYLDEEYAAHHVSVAPGRYVMLAVSDTGSGMDEETRARVFEPFFTTKEAGKGTGLGLSTVYGIVKQSGGYVWVYSEVGRGTTFKIYLPRVDAGAQLYSQTPSHARKLGGTETVLLAEDDELVRNMTRVILSDHGYKVLAEANGVAALSLFERTEEPIHLLLTDVVMPGMSGRELADRLTRLRPEMKVLFMSGYTEDAIVHHGVLDEGVNFIQKPFTPDDLARKVREVLGSPAESTQEEV